MNSITHATAQGARSYQEDRLVVAKVPNGPLLAVMDGHGGSEVAELLSNRLVPTWNQMFNDETEGPAFIKKVFSTLNEETKSMHAGSTMSLVFINESADIAIVAVLGDSPVLIKSGTFPTWIAPEHNARDNDTERAAAEFRGAYYANGYLWGRGNHMYADNGHGVQMSRAFGDADLTFLNREPEISIRLISKPSWILVATDGVLDPTHTTSGPQDTLIDLLNNGAEAKDLVARAVKVQTNDNATAIVWRNK